MSELCYFEQDGFIYEVEAEEVEETGFWASTDEDEGFAYFYEFDDSIEFGEEL